MRRRAFLAGVAVGAVAVVTPIVTAVAYTTRQLVAACRLWLKRHHVRRYATVTIIPGDGPPRPALLEPGDTWRWSPTSQLWVGPAFNVTWLAGDQIPAFQSPIDGQRVQLYVGPWTVEGMPALADPRRAGQVSPFQLMLSSGTESWSTGGSTAVPATALTSGSGVAFLTQTSPGDTSAGVFNLIPNPSFEIATTGWTSTSTLTRTANNVVAGSWSLRATQSGATGGRFDILLPDAYMPVTELTDYTFSLYRTINQGGAQGVTIEVTWFDEDPDVITTVSGGSSLPRAAQTFTSPALAAFARVRVFSVLTTYAVGDTMDMDAVMVSQGSTLYPYFDGDTPDDGEYTYDWTGTPGDSASVRYPVPVAPPPSPNSPGLDVLKFLGAQVAVASTFSYPPADVDGIGADGDYYLDKPGKALYGPKDDEWPDDPAVEGFNLTRLVR